jgi:hypothetical protein
MTIRRSKPVPCLTREGVRETQAQDSRHNLLEGYPKILESSSW